MNQSSETPAAFDRVPAEIWLSIVDILIRTGVSEGSKQLGQATKQIANHRYLRCLIHLATANSRFHSLIAPYVFSIFSARVLLWAAKTGRRGLAEEAISAGASLDVRNELRQTPLLLAARHGHSSIVELLLTTTDGATNVPAHRGPKDAAVIGENRSYVVAQSGSHCLDIEATDELIMSALGEAAVRGHSSITRLLIVHGASTSSRLQGGQTPLHLAASSGNLQTVQTFLQAKRIDWNAGDMSGHSPLFLAAANGHTPTVDFLMLQGAHATTLNLGDQTPLHIAAANGHKNVVEFLLRLPEVVPLARDRGGYTPADLAARNGHVFLAMLLCAHQGPLSTLICLNVATRNRLLQFISSLRPPRRIRGKFAPG